MGRRAVILQALPKAHLHLHLTGGMRHATLRRPGGQQGRRCPPGCSTPPSVDLDATGLRGWHRFQRLYDCARNAARAARTRYAGW